MNNRTHYNQKQLSQLFSTNISKTTLFNAEDLASIPRAKNFKSGAIYQRGWGIEDLPLIGEKFGFIPKLDSPKAISIFTTKGGVLKTTLTLNLARMMSLHNIKTCVVGLDMQGDITRALGHNEELEQCEDLELIISKLNETKGLPDVFNNTVRLCDVIKPTELPSLFYIPETPELAALNESLNHRNRREYWLKEKVIRPLKEEFDLILMDCSPNWNRLITNALVASDLLISPLECKINNFRNYRLFNAFLNEFRREMNLLFKILFVPTRYSLNRKLSMEIKNWYKDNIENCSIHGIRESLIGEEASALKLSVMEHTPTKVFADEFRELLKEIHLILSSHNLNDQNTSVDIDLIKDSVASFEGNYSLI